MPVEQFTESLTLQGMKCVLGENDFGFVYPQGDVADVAKAERLLQLAGGKPKECALDDYTKGGSGKAKPEYIITFKDDVNTIIVVECKKSVSKHETEERNRPKDYAVDGALYYAKFLKAEYTVIAVAVSGTKADNMRVSTFLWGKGQDEFTELRKARDIILEPVNYRHLARGEKIRRDYSLDDIRSTAIDMHEYLREIKMTERHKPIFIAGLLIALNDADFASAYTNLPSFRSVITNIQTAIDNVLNGSGMEMLSNRPEIELIETDYESYFITIAPEFRTEIDESAYKVLSQEDVDIICAKHFLFDHGSGGEEADFSGCLLRDLDLHSKQLNGAPLRGARFVNCNLEDCGFCFSDMTGAQFFHCRCAGLTAEEAQLSDAQFISSSFHGAYFTHSDCSKLKIRDCDLSGASFQNCCVDGTDFGDAELDEQQKKGCMYDKTEWDQASNYEFQPSF